MEFNLFTAIVLPIALGIIMLGMGLSLVPEDFLLVTKKPKAIAITAGLLKNPDMAIPAAIYSLFMNITAAIAIFYGRKFSAMEVMKVN
jgi:predicted Na+-dependent transporter